MGCKAEISGILEEGIASQQDLTRILAAQRLVEPVHLEGLAMKQVGLDFGYQDTLSLLVRMLFRSCLLLTQCVTKARADYRAPRSCCCSG